MEHKVSRFTSSAAGFSMVLVAGACCLATEPVSYGTQIATAELPPAPFYEPGTAKVLTTDTTSWDMGEAGWPAGKLCYSHHFHRLIWVELKEQYQCARHPR